MDSASGAAELEKMMAHVTYQMKVSMFLSVITASEKTAREYLDHCNGNVEEAVENFLADHDYL